MPTQILGAQIAADVPQITADEIRRELNDLTYRIIGAAQKVSRVLGPGFLEKVYENALCVELRNAGLAYEQQSPLQIRYEGEIVGSYVTDLLVEGRILVELKAITVLETTHRLQCVHYLKATGLRLGLLLRTSADRVSTTAASQISSRSAAICGQSAAICAT